MRYSNRHNPDLRQAVNALILSGGLKLTRCLGISRNGNPARQIVYYEHPYRAALSPEEKQLLKQHFEYTTDPSVCSMALAEWIFDNPAEVKDKVVVDLATGSGFPAIAAKQAGARQVTAVDATGETLIRRNAQANKTRIRVIGDNIFSRRVKDMIAQADVISLCNFFVPYESGESQAIQDLLIDRAKAGATILSAANTLGFSHGWRELASVGMPIRPKHFHEDMFQSENGRDPAITMVKVSRQTLGLG